jgi:tRNA dimethylallyltransferase
VEQKLSIIAVAGPTASGKSSLAVQLAQERDGEVISVDSRQVYRMLDIGTEKISTDEMQGVPHHLIDIRNPEEPYSAGDFVEDGTRLIEDTTARGKTPILAGGTHFYFDALLYGLPQESPIDEVLRAELETLTDEALFERVQTLDPRRAERLDPKNRRRLVRALEIIHLHGHVPERPKLESAYRVEWHVLNPDRDELYERISKRLTVALEHGLIDEVRAVRTRVGGVRLDELGLEYKIVGEYLRGEREEESLHSAMHTRLNQYARRQRAWLRKLEAERID